MRKAQSNQQESCNESWADEQPRQLIQETWNNELGHRGNNTRFIQKSQRKSALAISSEKQMIEQAKMARDQEDWQTQEVELRKSIL